MPQPGDGGLWPNKDDDKPRAGASGAVDKASAPVSGAKTNKLPVPDQQEKPAAGGWFDPPTADEPGSGSDKSHAKPGQQLTQPVSWPVAELAKAADHGESTVIVRPVELKPPPSNATQAATAFATPRKADKSGGDKSTRSSGPEKPKPTNRGWFDSPAEDGPSGESGPSAAPKQADQPPAKEPKQDQPAKAEPTKPEKPTSEAKKDHPSEATDAEPPSQSATVNLFQPTVEPTSGGPAEAHPTDEERAASRTVTEPSQETDATPTDVPTSPSSPAQPTAELPTPQQPTPDKADTTAQVSWPTETPQADADSAQPAKPAADSAQRADSAQSSDSAQSPASGRSDESAPLADGAQPPTSPQRADSAQAAFSAWQPEPVEPAGSTQPPAAAQSAEATPPADRAQQADSAQSLARGRSDESAQGTGGAQSATGAWSAEPVESAGSAQPPATDKPPATAQSSASAQSAESAESARQAASDQWTEPGEPATQSAASEPAESAASVKPAESAASAWPAAPDESDEPARPAAQPARPDARDQSSASTRPEAPGQADESDQRAGRAQSPASAQSSGSGWPVSPAEPGERVEKPAQEAEAARSERADKPSTKPSSTEGGHDRLAWPSAEPSRPKQEGEAADAQATAVFRPVSPPQETGSHLGSPPPSRPSASESKTSVFRPVEPPRTDRPEPPRGDRPGQKANENAATSFVRPVEQRPRQDSRPPQDSRPQQNKSIDGPTVNYLRPVQPPREQRPPENPPSFVRPRQPGGAENRPPENRAPERQSDWPPPEPPRATPQRVGPEEQPAKGKSRKTLLVTAIAIVAVIGIAAGVVFGVPGLAQKLGLSSDDTVAVAPPPGPISYTPGLHGPATSAPTPTKQGVEQALAGPIANPALGTVTGTVIDPATGEALYERDAGTAITPASTGKLLTAAAALLSLDHSYQLVTKVVQGDQPGEVIIVGGGDPTISSLKPGDDDSVFKGAAHLSDLVDQVRASGAQVNTVYIDQSRYAAPRMAPSWLPEDVGAGYIAPIVPAMLDADRRDATVNYSPRTNDPGKTLVDEFARRIGASPAGSIEKKASASAKVLGEVRSAPLSQLVDNMLDHSENTLGDILAHEVAIKAGQEPNFDGAAKAMLDILRQNKFDVDGVVLKDGSGMSTQNKVSAKLLAQILAVAAGPDGKDERTAKLRPLLGGLPVAGGSGTLEDRYNNGAATEGRGWVRAKTGTLTGVNSLAGIVMDKDNRPLIFAFLTADTEGATARPALDTVAAALRGCGCQ